MDHAPLILLPLVAEVLTFVYFITLVTHHTCFRKPSVFPEGSSIAPVCGFFLSHRPLSVFLISYLTTTLRSAQISQPEWEGDVGLPLGALEVSVTWWGYLHVEYLQTLVDRIPTEVLKQIARATFL